MATLKKTASLQETALIAAIIFVVFISFFAKVYSPKSKVLDVMKKEIKTLEVSKKSLKVQTEQLKAQKQKKQLTPVDSPNPKIQILKGSRVPEFSKMTTFLAKITAPSFQRESKLSQLVILGASEEAGYMRYPLKINAQGSFGTLANYIQRFDTIDGLVSVDSIFMAGSEAGTDQVDLEILATLYQVEGIQADFEAGDKIQ